MQRKGKEREGEIGTREGAEEGKGKGGRDRNERRCRGKEREGEIGTREGAEERKGRER